MKLVLQMY